MLVRDIGPHPTKWTMNMEICTERIRWHVLIIFARFANLLVERFSSRFSSCSSAARPLSLPLPPSLGVLLLLLLPFGCLLGSFCRKLSSLSTTDLSGVSRPCLKLEIPAHSFWTSGPPARRRLFLEAYVWSTLRPWGRAKRYA